MNSSITVLLPSAEKLYLMEREAPAIHPLYAIDFIGSSELPTVSVKRTAFGHLSHPGNS
jgi:hypothetical protein